MTFDPSLIRANVPQELQSLSQWVHWRMETRGDKRTKVPMNPREGMEHSRADSTDPETWAPLTRALAARTKDTSHGVGIVFNPPLVGIDMDRCVDENGVISDFAREVLSLCPSYAEFSPSGRGIHIICRGPDLDSGHRKGSQIEIYQFGRFFTVTGNQVPGTPATIEDCTDGVNRILAQFPSRETETPAPTCEVDLSDEELIERIRRSAQGEKFERLWTGSGAGYPSDSEATAALCSILAFWTGNDAPRMDRMFRASSLMREKWDEPRRETGTWGNGEIQRAIARTTETYQPPDQDGVDFADRMKEKQNHREQRRREKAQHVRAGQEPWNEPNAIDPDTLPAYPYAVHDNVIYHYRVIGAGENRRQERTPVCDFACIITQKAHTEDGREIWTLEGCTPSKDEFSVEVDARTFADSKQLLAAFMGPSQDTTVYAGMEKHLRSAIVRLSKVYGHPVHIRRYERVGWMDQQCKKFLMPGHSEEATYDIQIPEVLPYYSDSTADLDLGLNALRDLLLCKPQDFTIPTLCAAMVGPVARLADLQDERYCLFITGETGSFKTAFACLLMCLWGPAFIREVNLVKWGTGATPHSILALSSYATDLPYLVDNYKPATGYGQKGFIELIHNMLEGSDRMRLKRSGDLRKSRQLYCWPISTGEDTPGRDPATLARMLVFQAERNNTDKKLLLSAQRSSHHLCAIGREWIRWLETEAGHRAARRMGAEFHDRRAYWLEVMEKEAAGPTVHSRTASNLAINELTGNLIAQCPALAGLWSEVDVWDAHMSGLKKTATAMVKSTAEANEGARFLSVLSSLLSSGRLVLAVRGCQMNRGIDPDRVVGWEDGDGGAFLDEELAMAAVERFRGPDVLNGIGRDALRERLAKMGALQRHHDDRWTLRLTLRTDAKKTNTKPLIHIRPEFLLAPTETGEEIDA